MQFTQSTTLSSLSTLLVWATAQCTLIFLLWPASRLATPKANLSIRFATTIGLSFLCIVLGTAVALPSHSRFFVACVPFAIAAMLWLICPAPMLARKAGSRSLIFPAAATFFAAVTAALAWRVPFYQYDGLLYHLPAAALAWQRGTIFLETPHPQVGTNPVLPEMVKTWLFAIGGTDRLAALHQIPALLGIACLAYGLSRRWGARDFFPALAGIGVLVAPKAFEQATSPNVDLLAALAGSLAAVMLGLQSRRASMISLVAYAQIKYTTVLPALAGAVFLAARMLRKHQFRLAILWFACFLLLGGFWEWRNFFTFGNPTRPYQILVREGHLLSRIAPSWIVTSETPDKWEGYYLNRIGHSAGSDRMPGPLLHAMAWADHFHIPYDQWTARWGPAWFALALPALIFLALRRRLPVELQVALLFYAFTVKSWEARFGLVLLPFGMAAAAHLASKASRQRFAKLPVTFLFSGLLAWTAAQTILSHPFPALLRGANSGLALASRSSEVAEVSELVATMNQLNPHSLWIDFTMGERHRYGLPSTLLYPFFSSDWQRAIRIESSLPPNGSETSAAGLAHGALLLQPGSRLQPEILGYRKIRENSQGAVYAQ